MRHVSVFLLRWVINSFGLWLAVRLFGTGNAASDMVGGLTVFIVAGLIFSIVNTLLKPFVTFVSIPLIILTLGLFILIVNGLMVYLSLKLSPGISMTFGHAVIAGMVIGLVNFVVNKSVKMERTVA